MWQHISKGPGYVYLIRCGSISKIGLSINPQRRLQEIDRYGFSCHYDFVQRELEQGHRPILTHSFFVHNMRAVENALHARFVRCNCRDHNASFSWGRTTEWFTLSEDDIKWFCSLTTDDEEICVRSSDFDS